MRIEILVVVAALVAGGAGPLQAQVADKLQIGLHFTGFHVASLSEGAAGSGVRGSYELFRQNEDRGVRLSADCEFNYFPQNPSGNFGESEMLAGVKAGYVVDGLGFFVKVRPGLVHFGGADFQERNGGALTSAALDAGGVFEYSFSRRVAIRVDWGDTMVNFAHPIFTGKSTRPDSGGLTHNLQGSLGLMFRF